MRRLLYFAVIAAIGVAPVQLSAAARSVADFYKGRTIRMLVGYGPGTGMDVLVRLLAHHMGGHIPGDPLIVPENMPGAATLTMTNYLYNVAPRDGTVLGMPLRNILMEPLLGDKLAKFDPNKLAWIGSLGRDTELCFTWHTSGISTLDQAKTRKVIVGSTGPGASSTLVPRLLNRLLGTRFEPLIGYPDSGAIGTAMERGEVQGLCGLGLSSVESVRRDWLAKHEINILVQLALVAAPQLAGVPLVMDFAKDEATRQALTFALADEGINRPLAGPPGMPGDRVEALREAFDETVKDPNFLREGRKLAIDVDNPVDGQGVAEVIRQIYATPASVVDIVREIRNAK